MPKETQPSTKEFEDECKDFLAKRYPSKKDRSAPFVWGEGSDGVAVFEELDPETERFRMNAVREWRRELFDNGLGWIAGPVELGGRGLSRDHQRVFDNVVRQFDTPGSAPLTVSIGMVAPTILVHGKPELKTRLCAALQRGDVIACQLFSEPEAGSDLAGLRTRATRANSGWKLSGQKVWTSGAHWSDVGEIICRTSDGPRHRNLTAFIVDMHAPGVTVRPLRQMTGGASFNEVFLDEVWVPDSDRLGEVDDGWNVAMTTLSHERNAIGAGNFGGAGLFNFDRYIGMARQFGRHTDPVVRQSLARLYVGLQVAKLTGRRADTRRALGQLPGPEAALGKLALVGNFQRLSALVSEILGPRLIADSGEWGTYAWAATVLGVPGYRIGGGTDEVLKNVISERFLGLPR